MEYLYSKNRNTHEDLYDELRINFLRINNAFCDNKLIFMDLFEMFETSNFELYNILTPIVSLATQTLGVSEAVETSGGDEEEKKRWYEDIIKGLIEKMKKLPSD